MKFNDRMDMQELTVLVKDIKRDLKTLEQNEIRSTHSNSWSIKGTLVDINNNNNNVGILNSNIKDLVSYVQQLPDYMYDCFYKLNENILNINNSSKDNEKMKAVIEEQIDQISYQDTESEFNNKIESLRRTIKHL